MTATANPPKKTTVSSPTRPLPAAGGHWLLGSAADFNAAPHRFTAELAANNGGLAEFRVLNRKFLVVAHPDYAKHVLVTQADKYQRGRLHKTFQMVIGKGLVSTEGETWRSHRRMALPAFRSDSMKKVVADTAEVTEKLLNEWEELWHRGDLIPLSVDMRRLSMSVIGRVLLSEEMEAGDAVQFGEAVKDSLLHVRTLNTSAVRLPLWMPTPHHRQLHDTRSFLDNYLNERLAQRRDRAENPTGDIVDQLLASRDPSTGEKLTEQEVLDETKTLFIAGFETTSTALTWTLYLLAKHPEIAEKWHEEIDEVLDGRSPTWDDMPLLSWTTQIVQESMRLYPSVYNVARECVEEDVIDGCPIRKGTVVLLSIFGIHRSEEWWPEPLAFRPERFAPGADFPKHAFMPFGTGKHLCIGNNFALTEMVAALALIGQRFRIELVHDSDPGEIAQVTLIPAREIPLRLIPRR